MAWRTQLFKQTFACLENDKSPLGVVGIPMDYTGSYKPGSRFAPQRIRDSACNIELYSLFTGIFLEDIGFKDYGDVILPPGDIEGSLEKIKLVMRNIIEEHSGLLLVLGGEHLITYPVVEVIKDKIDELVIFDAHLDARSEYLGSKLNHATFLRRLLDEGVNVIHIGSRAYSRDEYEYVSSRDNIKVINVLEAFKNIKLEDLGRVYISIDMDVFDPSIAPGVSNPEPFGLSHYVLLSILRELFEKSTSVIGVDVVEVNPLVDVNGETSVLAAKLLIEVSGLYLAKKSFK